MKPAETRISVRIPPAMKKRLEKAAKATGLDEPVLVRRCVEALIEYVEENGSITFPLNVVPALPKADASSVANALPEVEGKEAWHGASPIEGDTNPTRQDAPFDLSSKPARRKSTSGRKDKPS